MPLLFAYGINRVSHDVAHIYSGEFTLRVFVITITCQNQNSLVDLFGSFGRLAPYSAKGSAKGLRQCCINHCCS